MADGGISRFYLLVTKFFNEDAYSFSERMHPQTAPLNKGANFSHRVVSLFTALLQPPSAKSANEDFFIRDIHCALFLKIFLKIFYKSCLEILHICVTK